jgi:agmatine deiminase
MSWAVSDIWDEWIPRIREELAKIIRSISEYETVILLTPSALVREARARFDGGNVQIVEAPVSDMWMRDAAPTFAVSGKGIVAVDWNPIDFAVSAPRVRRSGKSFGFELSAILKTGYVRSLFVAEGGALTTDGQGMLVTTRSCLLHPRRNRPCPGISMQLRLEREFRSFGIESVVWLEGDPAEPLTHGHVDGYVLMTSPGRALIERIRDSDVEAPFWRSHDTVLLKQARDASGRRLHVEFVAAPRKRRWRFRGPNWAPGYLNAYLANGAVITASFGDRERDEMAADVLQRSFPGRAIRMLRINHVASGGGGIRCLTQSIPLDTSGVSDSNLSSSAKP